MVVLTFDTWEEYDNAIEGITKMVISQNELFECARCGQDVLPSEHPPIGCDK
jgi:hypothetical protein